MLNLFISDLHLDIQYPLGIETFLKFLKEKASNADALYILGDLFEVWIGDEDLDTNYKSIQKGISDLRNNNTACYFMHGNRDFLVGKRFSDLTGCKILPEEYIIYINEEKILLTHGDLLCSDDKKYLEFRSKVRNQKWVDAFLRKPIRERYLIANDLRKKSYIAMEEKSEEIMDANANTVKKTMTKHNVNIMIHGHTHRPNIHKYKIENQEKTRIVLGAWHDDPKYLIWDDDGYKLISL
jgi:UDP-2,3-diacylglucosamine hydrolase